MHTIKTLLAGVAAATLATSAHAVVLYQNDFDGNLATDTGVTGGLTGVMTTSTTTVDVWNAAGWAGAHLNNRSAGNPAGFTTISLANLADHSTISMSFILGFLDSWDGDDPGHGPDFLEVWIDGTQVASMSTNTALSGLEDYDGGTELYEGIQADAAGGYYSDVLVDMSTAGFMTFAHSASTLNVGIRASGPNWIGASDEGWGIDNISISYDGVRTTAPGVPEPATWALMIGGFGMAGATLRRRRALVA